MGDSTAGANKEKQKATSIIKSNIYGPGKTLNSINTVIATLHQLAISSIGPSGGYMCTL